MLNDHGPDGEGLTMKSEKCAPDYEVMIKSAKDQLQKNETLQSAIANYIGHRKVRNQMAEMVGELRSEEWQLQKNIGIYMAEQEKE